MITPNTIDGLNLRSIDFPFTADGSGNASLSDIHLDGILINVELLNINGSAAFSAKLNDSKGFDTFVGQGASGSSSGNVKRFCPYVPGTDGTNAGQMNIVLLGSHSLVISGATNNSQGSVTIFIKKK